MYTLEYTIDGKFVVLRWEDCEYGVALLGAQLIDKVPYAYDVILKHNGEYSEIWPAYDSRDYIEKEWEDMHTHKLCLEALDLPNNVHGAKQCEAIISAGERD
jgi:uncharacterized protein YbdZ (MbtH family)